MNSAGHVLAIQQLNDIANASNGYFEILNILEPSEIGKILSITVSVNCKAYPKKENGIPFKVREKIRIDVPWDFPFYPPSANFSHKNYGSFPHVQWGSHICLYQSIDTEWHPTQGMFGFIERLDIWLTAGAEAQLDPIAMPLHPPIAYPKSNFKLVPIQNTPQPSSPYWGGYVEIIRENEIVAELGSWIEHGNDLPTGRLASVILLSGDMPFEYPTTMSDLLKALYERNVPIEIVFLVIQLGILRTEKNKKVIFILGSSMRGISGGRRLQHLTGWIIKPEQADKFREVILSATDDDKADIKQFNEWATNAIVEWCQIMEDRPEIVERRDSESVANFWQGKNVAILGCGAIGSSIANMLARAGVSKLQLFDKGIVTPGILVRQDFYREYIGYTKVAVLKLNINRINPMIQVSSNYLDLISLFEKKDHIKELMETDVIVDATASTTFSLSFENYFRFNKISHPPVLAMCIGHNADYGLMTLSNNCLLGLSFDVDRRSKIEFANSMIGKNFLEEFWPTSGDRRKFFQPEPVATPY